MIRKMKKTEYQWSRGTIWRVLLMFGYAIAMGWFYINPSLGWQKKGW